VYKRQFYHTVESNRIEKSICQREWNGIESNYFSPNRNAVSVNRSLQKGVVRTDLDNFFVDSWCDNEDRVTF